MATLKPAVSATDEQTGSPAAPVTLVEFGDYQCSYCGQAYGLVKQLQAEFGADLHFVFRNFPLTEVHPMAQLAALAAEAAGQQGQFWPMHDLLYENQRQLQPDLFGTLADKLGLDTDQFAAARQSPEVAAKVAHDFESGARSGVNGPPSFFINGTQLQAYDGSYESLREAVLRYV